MSSKVKNTTLELTVNPNYVQGWGVWEALRELIQNAMDGHDSGQEMSIDWTPSGVLHIRNRGVVLARETLLLGVTSKGDGQSRGKFGEGYKLAFLVLARRGLEVTVKTGDELWTPIIEKSDTFGAEVLKVRVRPATYSSELDIRIKGLSEEDWAALQACLLDVPGLKETRAKEVVSVGQGRLLQSEGHAGRLYVRGLFVGTLPDSYRYGYDLQRVQLDRDRKMADPFDLKYQIASLLNSCVGEDKLSGKALLELLETDCGEARCFADLARWTNHVHLEKAVAAAFIEAHGDAVPVSSMEESAEAALHGMRGVVVSKAVRALIEKQVVPLEARKMARALEAKVTHSWDALSQAEQDSFAWALGVIGRAEQGKSGLAAFKCPPVNVVDFYSDKVLGTFKPDCIRLARKLLMDRAELIATLVHEAAHLFGDDGTVEHRTASERIFGLCIANA